MTDLVLGGTKIRDRLNRHLQGQLPVTDLGCCPACSLAETSLLLLFQKNEEGTPITGSIDRTRFGLLWR